MAGIRNTAAAALDTTVTTLMTQCATYFALQQGQYDVDVRRLFLAWLQGKFINLDKATAYAVRTHRNVEEAGTFDKTLVQVDPLAGA